MGIGLAIYNEGFGFFTIVLIDFLVGLGARVLRIFTGVDASFRVIFTSTTNRNCDVGTIR